MFEAIAVILVTLGAWGYIVLAAHDLHRTISQMRRVRSFANMPTWFLVQRWWSNQTYTDQLCLVVAIPFAVWGFCFIAATF